VVYRSVGGADLALHEGLKPCFLAAFDSEGRVLWSEGERGSGNQPARPGPLTLFDFDGDGTTDLLNFWHRPALAPRAPPDSMADVVIQLRDAATGRVKRETQPVIFRTLRGSGANWVHQRLIVGNFRGLPSPRDFCVKLGDRVLAFADTLELLWSYRIAWNEYGRCSAYTPAVGDLDGDGRDEVNGGYYLLDHQGRPLWEDPSSKNMDSVAIAAWRDDAPVAIGSGHGQVRDRQGRLLLELGGELVPHGQELRMGRFLRDEPGPQLAIRHRGHHPDLIVVDTDGRVRRTLRLNSSPNETGMETVRWHGSSGPDLLCNGGRLWDFDRETSLPLPDLPTPRGSARMGWWHTVPADFTGDGREDVFVYNPWMAEFYLFSQEILTRTSLLHCPRSQPFANVRLMD
jgi:hypothetical protein